MIDPKLRSIIGPEIEHGEKVLWVGKPTPFHVLMLYPEELLGAVVATVMLGLFGLVFVPLTSYTLHFGNGLFSFFVLIFLAAMIFSVARPLYEYAIAGRTVYAVTDQRALIVKPGWMGQSVNSYYRIEHVERRTLANERGDLIFAHEPYSGRGRYGNRNRVRKIGFFGVDQPRQVERLLVENLTGLYPEFNR